jgi:hypothetical protein
LKKEEGGEARFARSLAWPMGCSVGVVLEEAPIIRRSSLTLLPIAPMAKLDAHPTIRFRPASELPPTSCSSYWPSASRDLSPHHHQPLHHHRVCPLFIPTRRVLPGAVLSPLQLSFPSARAISTNQTPHPSRWPVVLIPKSHSRLFIPRSAQHFALGFGPVVVDDGMMYFVAQELITRQTINPSGGFEGDCRCALHASP